MLIPLFDVRKEIFSFWGDSNPFVNYFVKTRPNGIDPVFDQKKR
jgi:hypothetical protein